MQRVHQTHEHWLCNKNMNTVQGLIGSQLLFLKGNVDAVIQNCNVKPVLHNIESLIPQQQQLTLTTDTQTQ